MKALRKVVNGLLSDNCSERIQGTKANLSAYVDVMAPEVALEIIKNA